MEPGATATFGPLRRQSALKWSSRCRFHGEALAPGASSLSVARLRHRPLLGRYGSLHAHLSLPAPALRARASSSASAAPSPAASVQGAEYTPWPRGGGQVHCTAAVHSSAVVHAGAVVCVGASVDEGAEIGPGAVVGCGVSVGQGTVLHANVALQHCRVGSHCILHQGVSVGAEGFGFYVDPEGNMVKKPQPMRVVIGDHVEIGANSCVDRGSWRDTAIGDHTKIDNLVQVGHNVVVGRCCIICGQTGLGGSSTLGDYVVLAGQVGVADHVSVASRVRVGAKSGVSSDITKPGDYAGYPAVPAPEWRRQVVLQRRSARAGHRDSKVEGYPEQSP